MHLRAARPTLTRAVVKLNEEVTGEGNAFVDLGSLPLHGHILEAEELADRVRAMTFAGQLSDTKGIWRRLPRTAESWRS